MVMPSGNDMKQRFHQLCLASSILLCYLTAIRPTQAQIVPDATLPVNSSVTSEGNTNIITGGTPAGSNLFHSFEQFSIPTGSSAYFNNALEIQNIISRVTGQSISNIDGLIRANGTANLFLLNPNGIIFGSNAQLNIGGSFLASTASHLNFADGTQFSATTPQTTPLLTVSVPIGLQFGNNAEPITIQGSNLRLQPEKTLALIGGDITLVGGNLAAEMGRIGLGAVTENGSINLNPTPRGYLLGYTDTVNFKDIQLSQQAIVDASGEGGGDIQVQARNLTLTDGSQMRANTSGSQQAGTLDVVTSESVQLIGRLADGTPSALQARVQPGATGSGGNVTIATKRLRLTDGARVAASSLEASGNAGMVTIRASDAVEIIGAGTVPQANQAVVQPSAISTLTTGNGNAGSVSIETGQLIAREGGQVSASTSGAGDAGNLTVIADDVELTGRSPDGSSPSGLLARVESGATGNARNLRVETRRLLVSDGARVAVASLGQGQAGSLTVKATDSVEVVGAGRNPNGELNPTQVSALTTGNGQAGNLAIETGRLMARDGGQVSASTVGAGNAGNLTIIADDVQLRGRSADGSFPSGLLARVEAGATGNAGEVMIDTGNLQLTNGARVAAASLTQEAINPAVQGKAGNITIRADHTVELVGVGTNPNGTPNPTQVSALSTGAGNAGSLTVTAEQVIVRDGANAIASGTGTGQPGNLDIMATSIRLDNRGSIEAESTSGRGGNIELRSRNLQLRRQSTISADAGTGGAEGNITIRAATVVLLEGSRVITDADAPQGGSNILITPTDESGLAIFLSPDSTINARGELMLEGQVEVTTPNILPVEFVDATNLIAQSCPSNDEERSEFVVTGRGGLPPNPREVTRSDTVPLTDLGAPVEAERESGRRGEWETGRVGDGEKSSPHPSPLVEAQGWKIGSKGEVILTAQAPTVTSHGSWLRNVNCHVR